MELLTIAAIVLGPFLGLNLGSRETRRPKNHLRPEARHFQDSDGDPRNPSCTHTCRIFESN